jgi:hypothetical protein
VSPRIRLDVVINNLAAWAHTTGKVFMTSDGSAWRPLVHIEDISRAVVAALAAPTDVIHDQAFNVGLDSENYRISELAGFVREIVPGCEIAFADGAEPDRRNYRVDCSKYARSFPDFPLQWRARAGVEDIYRSFRRVGLNQAEFQGSKYKRTDQLKDLLARGDIDDTLRWTRDVAVGERICWPAAISMTRSGGPATWRSETGTCAGPKPRGFSVMLAIVQSRSRRPAGPAGLSCRRVADCRRELQRHRMCR